MYTCSHDEATSIHMAGPELFMITTLQIPNFNIDGIISHKQFYLFCQSTQEICSDYLSYLQQKLCFLADTKHCGRPDSLSFAV